MNIRPLLIAFLELLGSPIYSQLHDVEEIAIEFMQRQLPTEGFKPTDFKDFEVISSYLSKNNGVTHVHIIQKYQGVEIENAIFNVNILPDGEVFHHGNSGVKDFENKVVSDEEITSCHEALEKCFRDLKLPEVGQMKSIYQTANETLFKKTKHTFDDILARQLYVPQSDGKYRKVWSV
ncbi:MAG: hypothetical protein KJP00_02650, partial [Bacteroidia bacterium]|nr:hypothetical protein [Bacteroidia bacterium]